MLDLKNITSEDVVLDEEHKKINIYISKPYPKSMEIDENKTVVETTENGFLRFGEIRMTVNEYKQL